MELSASGDEQAEEHPAAIRAAASCSAHLPLRGQRASERRLVLYSLGGHRVLRRRARLAAAEGLRSEPAFWYLTAPPRRPPALRRARLQPRVVNHRRASPQHVAMFGKSSQARSAPRSLDGATASHQVASRVPGFLLALRCRTAMSMAARPLDVHVPMLPALPTCWRHHARGDLGHQQTHATNFRSEPFLQEGQGVQRPSRCSTPFSPQLHQREERTAREPSRAGPCGGPAARPPAPGGEWR